MSEQDVLIIADQPAQSAAVWAPVVGPETVRLLDQSNLDEDGESAVRSQSVAVLSRCADPHGGTSRTGLVVGYVQSGKTLSFTTVVSLARDNGIPFVILLAGTKQNLHDQTAERLAHDLEVSRPGGLSPWALLENPSASDAASVAENLRSMAEAGVPEEFRRATVITVMKNPARLARVTQLVIDLQQHGVDIGNIPVLIVDDEADQAGLNAAAQDSEKEATATYRAILELRSAVKEHSYLMYTATPQAPLLINLADVLSPDFVYVLEPGSGYTGGRYFFGQHRNAFVKRLSPAQVEAALDNPNEPPLELQRALASYWLVVAQRGRGPVSMLVHPSHTTDLHDTYGVFVASIKDQWKTLLKSPGPDRDELVDELFSPAYDDLVAGGADMKDLDELLSAVPLWIGATQIRVVNAGTSADSEIKWNTAPSWILIGGNKLDRGFTVEGLATTYMPRKIGAGQVDTVQQRARFFGYKASYGLMCRAWISGSTADVFEHYVMHEQLLREELKTVSEEGTSLKLWKRRMLLESKYQPTRKAVIDLPYFHNRIPGGQWITLTRYALQSDANRAQVGKLRQDHTFAHDPRDPRPGSSNNVRATVPLRDVLALLADWESSPNDAGLIAQASLLLGARLDASPDLEADVYVLDNFAERSRTVGKKTGAITLQQGRNPAGGYPGDAAFFDESMVSVQFSDVCVKGDGVDLRVVGMAIRLPAVLAGAFLVQAGS